MRLPTFIQLLVIPVLLSASCQEKGPSGNGGKTTTYEFTESTAPLVNPERGFYGGAVDIKSASSPVRASAAKALRAEGKTLMYVGFYLTDFINGTSFDALREAGIKCVLRFAYQNSESAKPWDPTVEVTLRHVAQLKPLLQKNADVIFVLQAGFVGVWGEWYYTDHFNMNPRSDTDYKPRRQLADALLDALPESRQVALRTPQFKLRMYGLSLKDTLTAVKAHDGSALARLCGHNDCFGASADDYGTFDNESNDRAFWKRDTRYTLMGGETCKVSNYCTCPASVKDMEDYHWTYLNSGYHSSVLNRWKSSGCMEEIENRLGYRLVMEKVTFVDGQKKQVTLQFRNDGFAAPANPRNADLVWTDAKGQEVDRTPLGADPRTWHPGPHEATVEFNRINGSPATCWLELSDPLLPDRPEYSIALANEGVWDAETGWNKLFEL